MARRVCHGGLGYLEGWSKPQWLDGEITYKVPQAAWKPASSRSSFYFTTVLCKWICSVRNISQDSVAVHIDTEWHSVMSALDSEQRERWDISPTVLHCSHRVLAELLRCEWCHCSGRSAIVTFSTRLIATEVVLQPAKPLRYKMGYCRFICKAL